MSPQEWRGWDGHSVYPDDSTDAPVGWHKLISPSSKPARRIKLLVLAAVSTLTTAIILAAAAWVITIGWLKLVVLIVLVQL